MKQTVFKLKKYSRQNPKLVLSSTVLCSLLLITVLVFTALSIKSWIYLYPFGTQGNTRFIDYNYTALIDCYHQDQVSHLAINNTDNTVLYTASQSTLSRAVVNNTLSERPIASDRNEIIDVTVHLNYFYSSNPLYSVVREGHTTYEISMEQKVTGTDNCTVEILVFDNYYEYMKLFDDSPAAPVDSVCLSAKNGRNISVLGFTLHPQKYYYFGAKIKAATSINVSVSALIYSYNTSELIEQTCSSSDTTDHCTVSISQPAISSHYSEICVLAERRDFESSQYFRVDVIKQNVNSYTLSYTLIAGVFGVPLAILIVCCGWRVCKKFRYTNATLVNDIDDQGRHDVDAASLSQTEQSPFAINDPQNRYQSIDQDSGDPLLSVAVVPGHRIIGNERGSATASRYSDI